LVALLGVVTIDLAVRGVPQDAKQETSSQQTFEPANTKFNAISGNQVWAMMFNAKADPESLPVVGRERCKYLQRCTIYGWTDPKLAAGAVSLLKHEAAGLAFSYEVNRLSGEETTKWDCRKWERVSPEQCLP
jgi:hypothetical protein